jgi:D-xylose transport system permease protein
LNVPSFVITLGGLLAWQGVQLALLHDTTLIVPNSTLDAFGSDALPETASWVLGGLIVAFTAVQRLRLLLRKGDRPPLASVVRRLAETAAIAVAVLGGLAVLSRGQGVPIEAWIFLALVGLTGFVLQRTRAGRAVYAVGGNREAARRAGYRPNFVRVAVFALSGAFAALGGIYILSRGGTADTLTGTGDLVLVAIAAAVIGGSSLFGGRGSPWAAPIGAAVITTLVQGLNIANGGADIQLILEGAILVVAVAIDAVMRRRLVVRGTVST